MAMRQNGLAKLSEEAGEALQIAGKLIQYPELQTDRSPLARHPDGSQLRTRLEEELGDVLAAVSFVMNKLQLDFTAIDQRMKAKLALFNQWDNEP